MTIESGVMDGLIRLRADGCSENQTTLKKVLLKKRRAVDCFLTGSREVAQYQK
jgi:hypothetical protein